MQLLRLSLVVVGIMITLTVYSRADVDNEAEKAKVFNEASVALAATHPDLANALKKLADDEAGEIGKKDDDGKNEVAGEDAMEAKLLADSVAALQSNNPDLAARLKRMEDVGGEKD